MQAIDLVFLCLCSFMFLIMTLIFTLCVDKVDVSVNVCVMNDDL